jgi:DnaK suppressor protein
VTYNNDMLHARLESDRKHLGEQLQQIRESSPLDERREGSPFGKREEEATEAADLENRLAMEKRVLEQIAEVDEALEKFEQGTFGLCQSCGQPIAPERLEALPQAKLCVSCKAKNAKPK